MHDIKAAKLAELAPQAEVVGQAAYEAKGGPAEVNVAGIVFPPVAVGCHHDFVSQAAQALTQGVVYVTVVASVALAKLMERGGASAVIAEGMESGGHIGAQTTMTLVPQVVDAVSIPVIAAGGIADNRGFNAAFALGAEAVQMGTRFVTAKESIVHENYKQKVIKAKDIDSEVTGMSTGHPIRVLRNKMTRQYLKLEKEGAPFEELEKMTLGALRKAVVDGDTVYGSVMAGQSAGLVKKEETCKEIIEDVVGLNK